MEKIVVYVAQEYFEQQEREDIDWDETEDLNLVSMNEYHLIEKILACEMALYVMRRSSPQTMIFIDGSLIDSMVTVKRSLINEYEEKYSKYVYYNEYD